MTYDYHPVLLLSVILQWFKKIMTRPPKDTAIRRLQKALGSIVDLKQRRRRSPEFEKWRRDTKIAVAHTFGEDSSQMEDLAGIPYSLYSTSPSITDSDRQQAYIEGLELATAILQSMIEEVEEFWKDDSFTERSTLQNQTSSEHIMFSILHISDLHRSKEEPIDNNSLIAALLADHDRYMGESPQIPPVGAIVVSGDLIQGTKIGAPNWQQSMEDQYAVAEGFLSELCDRFLDGDRSRMVLIPGNHDVCWNTSRRPMEWVLKEDYPSNLYEALIEPDSRYRWCWKKPALFYIKDMAVYEQRMDYYWDFVESFYKNVDLPLSIDRTRGFQLFELCDRRIIVAAFDSIAGNDCFCYSSALPRGAVGKCAMALRDSHRSYDLKIAVWHHSIQGPPTRSDYMDISQVHEMIGLGFQLGLHGHQHTSGTQTQFVHLDQDRSMAVVSAGSLCAGNRDLPRGVNRQYNLIVIEDDFIQARVHVREMAEGEQFTRKRSGAFLEGFVEVSWQPPTDVMGGEIDAQADNAQHAILVAEEALHNGRPQEVVQALGDIDVSFESYARQLMIGALLTQKDWQGLINVIKNPFTIKEHVTLVSALIESNNLDEAQDRLNAAVDLDPATRAELQGRINIKKQMRQL